MKYFEDQYDSDEEWHQRLADLKSGSIATDHIPSVIVRLGKPLKPERTARAKEIVLSLAHHQDFLVRSQVVWFCRWGKLTETLPFLRSLLNTESEEIVREQIVSTIDYLSAQTKKKAIRSK